MTRRESYIQYLEQLLSPLKAYFTVGVPFGDVMSRHDENIPWLEMFARSMYGVAAYTAAVGNNEYVRIFNEDIHIIVTDPQYETFTDYDQKNVELIPIALMLYLHRKYTWDTYTAEERHSIERWLSNVTLSVLPTNNWQFFRVLVCEMLQRLAGGDYSCCIQSSWDIIDKCYMGHGWYRDGADGPKDYYIAFGYHFYSLLHAYLFPDLKDRNDIIHERARDFASGYLNCFDNNGRMIPYGRSLIYRFATLSFWSMYILTGHDEIAPALILNLIDKNLSWWQEQSITTDGLLNLGFAYRNQYICENYNSSGSPYWAFKFFLILLTDKESRIWPLPTVESDFSLPEGMYETANGDIVIARHRHWNIAYANSYNGWPFLQNAARYMRFAYNSACGFNLPKDATEFHNLSDDSSLVLEIAGVKHQREGNMSYRNREGILEYRWCCGSLLTIRTFVIPQLNAYCRIHLIVSRVECKAHETGFAILSRNLQISCTQDAVSLSNSQYVSSMVCLSGNGTARMVQNEVNSNIYYPHTAMPSVQYRIHKGYNVIVDRTIFDEAVTGMQYGEGDVDIRLRFLGIALTVGGVHRTIHFGVMNAVSFKMNVLRDSFVAALLQQYNKRPAVKSFYRKLRRR